MVVTERKLAKVTNYCTEFSNNTTIHGFRYFVDGNTVLIQKIWWLTAFCLCVYTCVTLVSSNWKKWEENPVFLTMSESPMRQWEIPFPAITVCPENKISATKYNYTEAQEKFQSGNMTDKELNTFADATLFCLATPESYMFYNHNFSIDSLNFLINNTAEALVASCLWFGNGPPFCSNLFSSMFTRDGRCFTFNMLDKDELFTNKTYISPGHIKHPNISFWNFDDNYGKTKKIAFLFRFTKTTDSLSISMINMKRNIDKNCDDFEGFKIFVHNPAELPQKYVRIKFDNSYIFEITPQVTVTNPSLKNYKPERRNCFYSYERPLKFFKIYTKTNCETECLANFTLKSCECTPFFMPHEESTRICGYSDFSCVGTARNKFYNMEMISEVSESDSDLTSCNCLASCTSVKYKVDVNVEEVNNFILSSRRTDLFDFSDAKFRFSDSEFVSLTRKELFGDVDFWANTGGLLGLCLGFSAMSFFEIVYYLTLRWMYNICCLTKCFWKRGVVDVAQ